MSDIAAMIQGLFPELQDLLVDVLCESQNFVRSQDAEYSVSLRDVKRFRKLAEWFYFHLKNRPQPKK